MDNYNVSKNEFLHTEIDIHITTMNLNLIHQHEHKHWEKHWVM
jgi:hypothetical protein